MRKKVIISAIVIVMIALMTIFIAFLNVYKNNKLVITRFDNSAEVVIGEFPIVNRENMLLVKNRKKFDKSLNDSNSIYKKINDDNYILYKDGYYFSMSIDNNIVKISNYVYESGSIKYEFFTLNHILPHTQMKDGYFYKELAYSDIKDNDFGISDKESMLNYFKSLNSNICHIDGNNVSLLCFTDISLGFEFKLKLNEERFTIYEKYFC